MAILNRCHIPKTDRSSHIMQHLQKGNLKSAFWSFSHSLPNMYERIEGIRKKVSLKRTVDTLWHFSSLKSESIFSGHYSETFCSLGFGKHKACCEKMWQERTKRKTRLLRERATFLTPEAETHKIFLPRANRTSGNRLEAIFKGNVLKRAAWRAKRHSRGTPKEPCCTCLLTRGERSPALCELDLEDTSKRISKTPTESTPSEKKIREHQNQITMTPAGWR